MIPCVDCGAPVLPHSGHDCPVLTTWPRVAPDGRWKYILGTGPDDYLTGSFENTDHGVMFMDDGGVPFWRENFTVGEKFVSIKEESDVSRSA